MNIPQVNFSFRKLKATASSSEEKERDPYFFYYTFLARCDSCRWFSRAYPALFFFSSLYPVSYDLPFPWHPRYLDGGFRFFQKHPGWLGSRPGDQLKPLGSCRLLFWRRRQQLPDPGSWRSFPGYPSFPRDSWRKWRNASRSSCPFVGTPSGELFPFHSSGWPLPSLFPRF